MKVQKCCLNHKVKNHDLGLNIQWETEFHNTQVPTAQGYSRGLEHHQGCSPQALRVHPWICEPQILQETPGSCKHWVDSPSTANSGMWQLPRTSQPHISSTPSRCKSPVLQNSDISVLPFWFFLSLEAGSVFPTQIKPRSDKFSRLSRCLPQISCPPFTSSPWPSIPSVHRLGGSSFPFLLTPFKSFPLDSHNSEITGTRCCFLVFPFNFQITSKLWPCLPRFCLKRGFIAVLSTAE